eukprot:2748295-Lingulodinium_polyedra.AAC.1
MASRAILPTMRSGRFRQCRGMCVLRSRAAEARPPAGPTRSSRHVSSATSLYQPAARSLCCLVLWVSPAAKG